VTNKIGAFLRRVVCSSQSWISYSLLCKNMLMVEEASYDSLFPMLGIRMRNQYGTTLLFFDNLPLSFVVYKENIKNQKVQRNERKAPSRMVSHSFLCCLELIPKIRLDGICHVVDQRRLFQWLTCGGGPEIIITFDQKRGLSIRMSVAGRTCTQRPAHATSKVRTFVEFRSECKCTGVAGRTCTHVHAGRRAVTRWVLPTDGRGPSHTVEEDLDGMGDIGCGR
jgi:hypothetical protein